MGAEKGTIFSLLGKDEDRKYKIYALILHSVLSE